MIPVFTIFANLSSNGDHPYTSYPIVIKDFKALIGDDSITLTWTVENPSPRVYEVYRSYGGKYILIGKTDEQQFTDLLIRQSAYYYLVDVSEAGKRGKHQVIYVEYDEEDH